ncbi:Uma2 family endonuclease [Nostoc sphaeroides CHAB 2801]|uniref:Uma2 family endonuclease n=1 Tax=Nostoc sphaeroides TaxID=446679 RepID=UPI001E2F8266|nr:Uma2 family endonuclease [Nostoc sphaeroides]MCC5633771.1 Uma2 family endonuclease [Nostoc sphaeroides CHAB 2801]
MLHIKYRFQSFEEYLSYDDGTDKLYELFNGELIEMPPESGINVEIATFLLIQFASLLDYRRVRGHGLELEVRGEPRNRYPDLTIIRQEHIQQLAKRNTIRLEMLPPLLVIEVVSQCVGRVKSVEATDEPVRVSPGELQRDRDFIAKRSQYQDCGIPEYWIIDPEAQTILILELIDKTYTEIGNFSGNDLVVSPQFSQLNLKVSQIFDAVNQA